MLGELLVATDTVDDAARGLYMRHYSSQKRPKAATAPRFIGPGEALVLVTVDYSAVFAWRLSLYRMDAQTGVECVIFRNEGEVLSSEIVAAADDRAWERWPGLRHFTFVDAEKVASSNPGFCFKRAGWKTAGRSAGGLHILERWPDAAAR